MKGYEKTTSGAFLNYLSSDTALPIYYTPLPSCASESDAIWVLVDSTEVFEGPIVEPLLIGK